MVLLITRNLPPMRGGMERLNLHLVLELLVGSRLAVVGPEGCGDALPDSVEVVEVPSSVLARFFMGAFFSSLKLALLRRPRIVLAGSGLCAPFAWLAARLVGARCVVYLHGLDIVVPNRVYRWFWLPFIRRCDLVLVNSRNTASLALEARVEGPRIRVLHPGVSLATAQPSATDMASFRDRLGWAVRPVLLSVGRLTERKGILDFVERILPLVVTQIPDVLLAVIGNDAPDALVQGKESIRSAVEALAHSKGLTANLRMHGELEDDQLEIAYASAHLAIFPVLTLPGDVEGFGMVAIEAAAHGLSTVAYAAGGVPDAVKDGVSGTLIASGDAHAFAEAIVAALAVGRGVSDAACRQFASGFDWAVFGTKLRELLELDEQH